MVASAHTSAAAGPSIISITCIQPHPTPPTATCSAPCAALSPPHAAPPAAPPLPEPTGSPNTLPAEQLEAHGAELCQRSVMTLFDNNAAVNAALEAGTEPQPTCADWEMAGEGRVQQGVRAHMCDWALGLQGQQRAC